MKSCQFIRRLILSATLAWTASPVSLGSEPARGEQGMVATVHAAATDAGIRAMRRGGNAVDAAVACALVLGVVDGFNSGIGGGCFILIHRADGRVFAIDGRETAPALARRDMFLRGGKADPELSRTGALAIGVPGALAAYEMAMASGGWLSLADHLRAAAEIADAGFEIDAGYASRLESAAPRLAAFAASRAVYLHADGSPRRAGERLVQRDLARTYRSVADHGTRWFYGGPFAMKTDAWMRENNGLVRASDFAGYRARMREPIRTRYRDFEIVGFPPPSSGGVHVAQILNILERVELTQWEVGTAPMIHHVAEAMKLAFADRAHWLGDPDFAPVPRGLISKQYAADLALKIRPEVAVAVTGHGDPPDALTDVFGRKHTTHFSTADAEGNWVACTATINTTFGSKVVIPGTGVVMNNEMDDFSAQPGVPNFFGLIGAEANAVQPGKRPLSSMSPTLVLKEDAPVLSVGAAGGPTIISQTALNLVYFIDYGLDVDVSLRQPRFHHQWRPDELKLESGIPKTVADELAGMGHTLRRTTGIGVSQAVSRGPGPEPFRGAADPRNGGSAKGY